MLLMKFKLFFVKMSSLFWNHKTSENSKQNILSFILIHCYYLLNSAKFQLQQGRTWQYGLRSRITRFALSRASFKSRAHSSKKLSFFFHYSQRLAPCFFQHGLSKFLITLRSSPSEPLNFLIMEFKSSGLKDISNLGCNPQPQNQGKAKFSLCFMKPWKDHSMQRNLLCITIKYFMSNRNPS